jgi:hypothetical protein
VIASPARTEHRKTQQPFWLNTSDPHRMRAAMQMLTNLLFSTLNVRDHEWQSGRIWDENVWEWSTL